MSHQIRPGEGPAASSAMTARTNLQIVTPSQVRTNLALGSNVKVSVLTEILIHFIPEPGVMLRENLIAWLEASGIFQYVVAASDTAPDWILESRLETLYADRRGSEGMAAVASLKFTLLDATDPRRSIVFQENYEARAELEGRSPDRYVIGVETVLAQIFGRLERDGYKVEKVYFESLPGFYVTGNLYRPKGVSGKRPAVLSPHVRPAPALRECARTSARRTVRSPATAARGRRPDH